MTDAKGHHISMGDRLAWAARPNDSDLTLRFGMVVGITAGWVVCQPDDSKAQCRIRHRRRMLKVAA